jgi:drug/metabolite transporter (DMT)-like permease
MFIGEMACWLVVGGFTAYQRYAFRKAGYEAISTEHDEEPGTPILNGDPEAENSDDSTAPIANPLKPAHAFDDGRIPLTGRKILLLALPACCDIAGTTLMNVGLLFVAASIYQMTRGALVLFVGLFSVLFLKRRLGAYKWFALFVVVVGVAIVGLAGALSKEDGSAHASSPELRNALAHGLEVLRREVKETARSPAAVRTILGVFLIAGAQIFTATQFVLEESIMERYAMEPIKVVSWEGTFGFIVTVIGMIILHFAIGQTNSGHNGYFDAREGLWEITHFRSIAVSSVLIMISIG